MPHAWRGSRIRSTQEQPKCLQTRLRHTRSNSKARRIQDPNWCCAKAASRGCGRQDALRKSVGARNRTTRRTTESSMTAKQKTNKASSKQGAVRNSVARKPCSTEDALEDELIAAGILIPGEDARELRGFVVKTIAEFNPVGHVEKVLSGEIAIALWRRKRIPRFELAVLGARDAATADQSPAKQEEVRLDHLAEMASRYLPAQERDREPPQETVADPDAKAEEEKQNAEVDCAEATSRALIHDSENGDVLGKILRAERSLNSTLERLTSMLIKLQAARRER